MYARTHVCVLLYYLWLAFRSLNNVPDKHKFLFLMSSNFSSFFLLWLLFSVVFKKPLHPPR